MKRAARFCRKLGRSLKVNCPREKVGIHHVVLIALNQDTQL